MNLVADHSFHKMKRRYIALVVACLLAFPVVSVTFTACALFGTNVWNTAKVAGDTGRASVHAWNLWYAQATNGVSANTLSNLNAEQTQVYDASRKLGASLIILTNLAESYTLNSADTNKAALQAGLDAVLGQSKNVAALIKTFMGK